MKDVLPFLLQGLVMGVDEFFCHRHRELRRWERVGHPLDTLLYLLCLILLLVAAPSEGILILFAVLSVISCIFITKDEWQHRELCSGFENWLHALLFMLHPMLLIWAGWLWWTRDPDFLMVIGGVAAVSALFALYQTIYWNFVRHGQ